MYRTLVSTIGYEINLIAQLRNRPVMKDPGVMVSSRRDEVKALRDRSIRSFGSIIEIEKKELTGVRAHLRSLSPQSTMDRGYSVVQLDDGTILRDATKVKVGTRLRIRVAKGETTATVSSPK
jgi:exodeoxyribonuclease VII large subunit